MDEAKGILYSRLQEQAPGPGYCHFPEGDGYEEEYCKQLTAEKKVIQYQKGFSKAEWIKAQARNESLECRAQVHAARCLLNPRWKAVEKNLAPRLPLPEEALAAAAPARAGHEFRLANRANGNQLRKIAASKSWVTWRRR